jgi:hypothetical protein
MGPPTDPSILKRDLLPFSVKSREQALYARANQLGYDPKHIKYKTDIIIPITTIIINQTYPKAPSILVFHI